MTTQTDKQAARSSYDNHHLRGDVNKFTGINRMDYEDVAIYFFEDGFLAGIAHRDSQKQEVVKSFEDFWKGGDWLNYLGTYHRDEVAKEIWLACAESMEAKHREEIEKLQAENKAREKIVSLFSRLHSEDFGLYGVWEALTPLEDSEYYKYMNEANEVLAKINQEEEK